MRLDRHGVTPSPVLWLATTPLRAMAWCWLWLLVRRCGRHRSDRSVLFARRSRHVTSCDSGSERMRLLV